MRKDERVAPPDFRVRCRRCGRGHACHFLVEGEASGLRGTGPVRPPPIELDVPAKLPSEAQSGAVEAAGEGTKRGDGEPG